jgi:hypothetical protein
MVTTWRTVTMRTIAGQSRLALAAILAGATVLVCLAGAPAASAAPAPVSLGTAASYGVLAASTVTNTGPTTINGDLGLSPGTAITGFPPGHVTGTVNAANSAALQAKNDLTTAYNAAAAAPVTATIPVELGGTTVTPGVYASPAGTFGITGTLTLDAQGNPNAVFIFQAASTLITASASNVVLVNGAQAANVFWVVGSSATLGTFSIIQGNIMALASITVTTGVTVDGRALARTAAVTLDSDTITVPTSVKAPTITTTSLASSENPVPLDEPVTFTAAVAASTGTAIPSGLVAFTDGSTLLGVVTLDQAGQAALTICSGNLGNGLHRIRAYYIGASGFESSHSPAVFELVGYTWPAFRRAMKAAHRAK